MGWNDPLRFLTRAIEECARAGDLHDRGWSVGRSLRSGFCLRPGYRRAERYAAVARARLAAPYNVMLPLPRMFRSHREGDGIYGEACFRRTRRKARHPSYAVFVRPFWRNDGNLVVGWPVRRRLRH